MKYNLNEEYEKIIKEINDKKYFQVIECLTILKDHNGVVEIHHSLPYRQKYDNLHELLKYLGILNGACINVVKLRKNEYKLIIKVGHLPMFGFGASYEHHRIVILSNMEDLHEDYVTDSILGNS